MCLKCLCIIPNISHLFFPGQAGYNPECPALVLQKLLFAFPLHGSQRADPKTSRVRLVQKPCEGTRKVMSVQSYREKCASSQDTHHFTNYVWLYRSILLSSGAIPLTTKYAAFSSGLTYISMVLISTPGLDSAKADLAFSKISLAATSFS